MTVRVRGRSMSPELTAQVTAPIASCSTSAEMPDWFTAPTFTTGMTEARTTGAAACDDAAAGALTPTSARTGRAGTTAAAGAAKSPSATTLLRQTIVPTSRLATLPFNLLTSRNVCGLDTYLTGWWRSSQAEQQGVLQRRARPRHQAFSKPLSFRFRHGTVDRPMSSKNGIWPR